MKQFKLLILVLLLTGMLFGCGTSDHTAATPAQETAIIPTVQPTAQPVETTALTSQTPQVKRSYTTGLPYDGAYKPVLTVIENSAAARPQTGLQQADIVYEVPVESSITRFVCVFSDKVPSEVMPVRSARVPFLYIVNEWSAVFMHFGGSGSDNKTSNEPFNYYGHELYALIKYDVDGLSGRWDKFYHRVSGAEAPHNVMGNPQMAQALYDYEPKPISWLFDDTVKYEGTEVNEIRLEMCSSIDNYVSYSYDAANDCYLRFMSGKMFMAAETGKQVSVKNVIVQYSTYTPSQAGVKIWKMTGSGTAEFYIGGKHIEGSWERKSVADDTVFYDNNGRQIVLKPGNTWVHLQPEK